MNGKNLVDESLNSQNTKITDFCSAIGAHRLHFLSHQVGIVSMSCRAWQNDSVFSMMASQNQSQSRPKQVYFRGVFQKICILQCLAQKQVFDCPFLGTNLLVHLIYSCKERCWRRFHCLTQILAGQHFLHGKLFQHQQMLELWV